MYLDGNSHLVYVSAGLNPSETGPWLVVRKNNMAGGMHRLKQLKGMTPGGMYATIEAAQAALDAYARDKRWRKATAGDLARYGVSDESVSSEIVQSPGLDLAAGEADALARLEAIIHRGLGTFIGAGTALIEIRDRHLYRSSHAAFRDYCYERWGISDRHGRRLIAAAEVAEQLQSGPNGPLPAPENEAQAANNAALRAHVGAHDIVPKGMSVERYKAILHLIWEVRVIAHNGYLPDGDHVNAPTAMWFEEWAQEFGGPLNTTSGPQSDVNART